MNCQQPQAHPDRCGCEEKVYPRYEQTSQLFNPWFGSTYVRYNLVEVNLQWFDPSYGNGGGCYEEVKTVIFSSRALSEIHSMKQKLELIK